MPGPLKRLFAVESLIGSIPVQGDLPTTREAYRDLAQIALPSVLEMVLTSLIGSIDTMMVGTLGSMAIAAVGLVGQPR
ncbi:MAG: MATE family efflux transporter, partial [Clostridia bacterium]|nr:MATE family efflux transporter [Clostridia bacterium]